METAFYPGLRHGETTVFFLGWGMDPTPFEGMARARDTLFVWDYTDLSNPPPLPEGPAHLIAWSLGVWAAAQTLPRGRLASATAVNGTPWPIDAARGIPPAIFDATLAGLSEAGLARFRRRMCGGAAALGGFLAHAPKRGVESLRAELAALGAAIRSRPGADFAWGGAVACRGDRIFPFAAQLAAFPGATAREGAHWAPEVFAALLGGRGA